MARKETLPPGLARLPSQSLRARIRLTGRKAVAETFPLHEDTPDARRVQLQTANAWLADTRRKLENGVHVDFEEAKTLTVGDCLRIYRDEGLKGKPRNAAGDRGRINIILQHDIAAMPVLSLRSTTLARYRDELIDRAIKVRGKPPARSTLGNTIQLVTRALRHVGDTVDGIPEVATPKLPPASPGRERRVSDEELRAILEIGAETGPLLPRAVRFSIATALRKSAMLSFRPSYIEPLPGKGEVIRFPKSEKREKRIGIIPVTIELRKLITESRKILGVSDSDEILFNIGSHQFDDMWQETLHIAGIHDLHYHDLRHEATSKLFEAGLSAVEVMTITGHSTQEMVDRYSHYSSGIVLEKLNKGANPDSLIHELELLISGYMRAGGDSKMLKGLVARYTPK